MRKLDINLEKPVSALEGISLIYYRRQSLPSEVELGQNEHIRANFKLPNIHCLISSGISYFFVNKLFSIRDSDPYMTDSNFV